MPTPIALKKGATIGAYTISKLLATTQYGVMYRATTSGDDGRNVRIQEFLPRELATRTRSNANVRARNGKEQFFEEALTLFLQEARVLAQIHDPYIARVHEYTEANGTAYLVMEYDPGQSLESYLSTHNTLSEQELRNILIPILKGLRVVHNAHLLHRDITPAAIYLRRNGPPLLTWFGACHRAAKIDVSLTHRVTPGYSPIELYHENTHLEPASDLYALGAVMYRCIAGSPPVDPTSRLSALAQHEDDPLVPAMELGLGTYSSVLLGNIDWMLKPMLQDRPESAGALLGPLSTPAAAETRPAPKRTLPQPSKLPDPRPRINQANRRRGMRTWIAAVAATLALVWLTWTLIKPAPEPESVAQGNDGQTTEQETPSDASRPEPSAPDTAQETTVATVAEQQEQTSDPQNVEPQAPQGVLSPEPVPALTDLPPEVPETVNFNRSGDQQRAAQYRELQRKEHETQELLASARSNIAEGKLMEALDQSKQVLAIDANNADAKEAIAQVADRMLAQAKSSFAAGQIEQSEAMIEKIAAIAPDHFGLVQIRQQVAAYKEEQQKIAEKQQRVELEKKAKMEELLHKGNTAVDQHKYMEPAGDNALEYFRAALALDPANKDAQGGIDKVAMVFLERANQALAVDDFERAATHLATATAIQPENQSISLLRQQLKTRRVLMAQKEAAPTPPVTQPAPPPAKQVTSNEQKLKEEQDNLRRGIEAYYAGSYDKANRLLTTLAQQGNARAQMRLGIMYYLGRGVTNNRIRAEEWIRKALPEVRRLAQQGVAWAQADLGSLYEDGLVLGKDVDRAVSWYTKAAEQGYAGAQTNLGVMYAKGIGVDINIFAAISWLERAAAQGDRVARENLLTLRNEE